VARPESPDQTRAKPDPEDETRQLPPVSTETAEFIALDPSEDPVAEIASRNRTEADDVATRAGEAAQGLSDLERATRELEEVATMLRELTRGFASVA